MLYLHSEQNIIISVLVIAILNYTESQDLLGALLTIEINLFPEINLSPRTNQMKRPPNIIKAYESLPRNPQYPLQEFRLRVVKYHNSTVLLDLREYVTSDLFTGYSPKGISLNREQLIYLSTQLHDILECMRNATGVKSSLKQLNLELSNNMKIIPMDSEETNENIS